MAERPNIPSRLTRGAADGTYAEVEIGAWVRRRRRKRIAIAASGLLLMGLAGCLYWLLSHGVLEPVATRAEADMRCIADECAYEFTAQFETAAGPPTMCPRCGQKSLREVWACRKCGARFVLGPTTELACPKCRSRDVGSGAAARKAGG